MYLSSSSADGSYHTWRQRYPDGQPEQITSGPTEEEGFALFPDGRSFVTSVAFKQSVVLVHDASGDRQISMEGYSYDPKFTPDGKQLCYRILKGGLTSYDPGELHIMERPNAGAGKSGCVGREQMFQSDIVETSQSVALT